jgi:hypothetical protein
MRAEKTLQEIFEALVELNVIKKSRVGPVRTAIKQYARILDFSDPRECPISAYLKSDTARNQLIEERAPQTLGSNGIRNLKNNVSYILRKAIELDVISPLAADLASWSESNPMTLMPKRNESVYPAKFVIDPVPQRLAQEIAEYENWSTRINNRMRPKRLQKRPISFYHHRQTILLEAGYLVKFRGLKAEAIGLLILIEPNNAIDYVEWCIERQKRHTKGSEAILSRIIVLARYLEITVQTSEQQTIIQRRLSELRKFSATLGTPIRVQHKEKRWLDLVQLEKVGRSIYPLNARRINELSKQTLRNLERGCKNRPTPDRKFTRCAFRVLQSLLIRLVIRIPLRQRNLREMQWAPSSPAEGRNLYRKERRLAPKISGKRVEDCYSKRGSTFLGI